MLVLPVEYLNIKGYLLASDVEVNATFVSAGNVPVVAVSVVT